MKNVWKNNKGDPFAYFRKMHLSEVLLFLCQYDH